MSIIKKVLKWFGGIVGVIIILVIIASVVLMFIVDKELIENEMKSALNRHVTIDEISIGAFSMLSGIEVNKVAISNFKTEKQLKALNGKPVKDLFIGMKQFNFKLKLSSLLQGQFELKELVLHEPQINIIRGKKGYFNFSDLLIPKKLTAKEKKALKEEKEEDAKQLAKEKKEAKDKPKVPEKPFTADDLPVAINIGKVGIENGNLLFKDIMTKQTFQVYGFTVMLHSFKIDPAKLEKKNSVKITVKMGMKTIGKTKSGSVQSFDIGFALNGNIIPFDLKSRKVDPSIAIKMGMPYGTMTGLQIFESMNSVDKLSKYCGKFSFLKKKLKWKNAFMRVFYKGGTVKIQEGKLQTDDYKLAFKGKTNINTEKIDMDIDMILADKHKKEIRSGIKKNVKKGLKGELGKYVKADKVTNSAMKPMLNKEGAVYLRYKITGKTSKPKTKLVHPILPSIKEIITKAAGKTGDLIKSKASAIVNKKAALAKKKAEEEKKKAAAASKKKAAKKFKKRW